MLSGGSGTRAGRMPESGVVACSKLLVCRWIRVPGHDARLVCRWLY